MHATCPECDRKLHVPAHAIGKRVECPSCGAPFQITHVSEAARRAERRRQLAGPSAKPKPASREPRQRPDDPAAAPRRVSQKMLPGTRDKRRKQRQGPDYDSPRLADVDEYNAPGEGKAGRRSESRESAKRGSESSQGQFVRGTVRTAMMGNFILGPIVVIWWVASSLTRLLPMTPVGAAAAESPEVLHGITFLLVAGDVTVMVLAGLATKPANPKPMVAAGIILLGGILQLFAGGLPGVTAMVLSGVRQITGNEVVGVVATVVVFAVLLGAGRIIAWLLWYSTLEDIIVAARLRRLKGVGNHLCKFAMIWIGATVVVFGLAVCIGLISTTVHPIFSVMFLFVLAVYGIACVILHYVIIRGWILTIQIFVAV